MKTAALLQPGRSALEERIGVYEHLTTKSSGIVEFGYWNNTDAPDGIHPRTWRARARAWERALVEGTIQFEMRFQPSVFPDKSALEEAFRPREERARRIAKDAAVERYLRLNPLPADGQGASGSLAAVSRLMRQAEQALATEGSELAAWAAQCEKQISAALVEDVPSAMRRPLSELPVTKLPD